MIARRHFALIWSEFRTRKADFLWGLLATLLSSVVGLLLPQRAQVLISDAFPSGDVGRVAGELALILFIATLALALMSLRKFLMDRISHKLAAAMRARLFERVLTVSPRSLQEAEGGMIMSNFSNDLAVFTDTIRQMLSVAIPSAILTTVYLTATVYYSWQLSLVLVLIAIPMVLVTGFYGRKMYQASADSQTRLADLLDQLGEVLTGAKEIKLFEMEPRVRDRFGALNDASLEAHVRREYHGTMHPFVLSLTVALGISILILAATWLLARGMVEVGAITAFVVCLGLAYAPLQEFANSISRLVQLSTIMDRIETVLTLPPERDVEKGPEVLPRKGGIRFENVHFGYGSGPVIEDFTLDIAPGERIAVVGPSGAGKSTLLEMLPRFLELQSGRIEVDGNDIAQMPLRDLRSQIGLVLQQPFLFRASLRDNLTVGARAATDARIREVAAMARVDQFADALPDGYATLLEPGGSNLSVGQRQRIAIARVLLKDPPILLLDEPTSALDSESERLVTDAIRQVSQSRTTIIVAHRLSTVRDVDRVVVLDRGRIVEQGKHDDLIAKGGLFADLARSGEILGST